MVNRLDNIKTAQKSHITLLGFTLGFFILDRFWGFVYSHTIYSSVVVTYVVFIVLLILFLRVGLQYNFGNFSKLSLWWSPYIFYTLLGFILRFTLQSFTYWFCCLVLILIATRCFLLRELPLKIIFWSGFFALVGVFVQLYFPDFYNSHISPLYLREELISLWSEGYGMNGFTYQLGTTAAILLYGELVLVCMKDKVLTRLNKRELLYYIILIIFIIGIFLTGKRTLSVLAVVIPIFLFYLRRQSTAGRFSYIIIIAITMVLFIGFFVNNVKDLESTRMFSRLASSYEGVQAGKDISSGRDYLYDMAIKGYKSSPIFGIGVGRFMQFSGANTDVHNTYLQVLCEQGIVGVFLYIMPLLVSFLFTLRLYRRVSHELKNYVLLSISIQTMHILNALTENCNLGESFIMYFLAIAIAISVDSQYQFKPVN